MDNDIVPIAGPVDATICDARDIELRREDCYRQSSLGLMRPQALSLMSRRAFPSASFLLYLAGIVTSSSYVS
jgi:hypothetical protein